MKADWLIRKQRSKLLLFFNGWGMDSRPFEHLSSKEYDLICLYAYTPDAEKSFEAILPSLEHYQSIVVIAWSWGVYMASKLLNKTLLPIEFSLAINGTLYPVDRHYGIPPLAFQKTFSNFSEQTYDLFLRRMFASQKDYIQFQKPKRNFTRLKEELSCFYPFDSLSSSFNYHAALVCKKDRIIPPQNQLACWQQASVPVILLDSGHFPFYGWKEWDELIEECWN